MAELCGCSHSRPDHRPECARNGCGCSRWRPVLPPPVPIPPRIVIGTRVRELAPVTQSEIPAADPADPHVRLLRAIFGQCPDCNDPEQHEHPLKCSRCGFPAVERDGGGYAHASPADAAFCALVMGGGS